MKKRFLIVCQARTGSSMLASAMQKHPEICAHGEVLNLRTDDNLEFYGIDYNFPGGILDYLRKERNRAPDEYLDRYVFYPGRFKAAGFKFKYEEMANPLFSSAKNYVLRNTDIHVIHMTRNNLWQRFLSEYIALNITKRFNSTERVIEVQDTTFHLDPDMVHYAMDQSLQWQEHHRTIFARHPVTEVTYEDFTTIPADTFRRVTDFLGVGRLPFEPATTKINKSQPDEALIENYDEICQKFKGTRYEAFF
jgi:hypothetical protein